jgi:hypothetical protein
MDSPEERHPPDSVTSDTDNATTIQPSDAPLHRRRKFEKFRSYNTNMWNGPRRENTEQFRRQDDLHRYDSIAASLDLTSYQKSRGRKMLDNFGSHTFGYSIDHIIFGICVLTANLDVEDGCRYYPNSYANDDELFCEVAESFGFSQSEQAAVVEKIRSKVNL